MLAESSVIFLATALHQTVDHSTLLARLATSAVRLVTFLATAHRRLPTVTFLPAMLTWVPLLPQLSPSYPLPRFVKDLRWT